MTTEQILVKNPKQDSPIDIIVPAHNKFWMTAFCIENLYLYTQLPFHLIVVDDSTDLTPLYMAKLKKEKSNITYIHSNEPYKEGNQFFNAALEKCRYDYVATVMNSIIVQPDWELVAVEILKGTPQVATVGLKCLMPWGTIESAGITIQNAKDYSAITTEDGPMTSGLYPVDIGRGMPAHLLCNSYEREAVQWAFAIHRREALIGNLEEGIFNGFRGWDDIDNCFALRKAGWKIYFCGSGVGYHYPRSTRGVELLNVDEMNKNKENGRIFRTRWGLNGLKPEPITAGESNRATRRRKVKANVRSS